ncbi:MAG: hypothetical protein KI791_13835 [Cyclobacteriaceae bacterium]|nr:hypothetical protein [Cyclobacteriaceae bacterium SS2]
MKRILFIATLSFFLNELQAQDCACCTIQHQQFDFWLGDWNVYDTLGNLVGENAIEKLVAECVLSEFWRGASGGVGRSYNYFNLADSTWNQVWIDASGSNLELKGKLVEGKMILQSELLPGQKVDWYRNSITWTPNEDGCVTQLWEILDKEGKVISQVFKGIYKKK